MRLSAVIGANYGDEGKGLVTDYLSQQGMMTTVVRYNGGAQAGHTVVQNATVTSKARRHVFHHFGSGALSGAATFLSRFFILNPILFVPEWQKLFEALGHGPVTMVDPRALVTTPYDMLLNQFVETARGDRRHGSCGVGINETVVRSLSEPYRITFRDLEDIPRLKEKLRKIEKEYVPDRLNQLDLSGKSLGEDVEAITEHYLQDVDYLWDRVSYLSFDQRRFGNNDNIVFEGAQGLGLDMDAKDFPHVTRSKTGLTNVMTLLQEARLEGEPLIVHYVTRPYVTRHGAGPLPHKLPGPPTSRVKDETNVPHDFQGSIRFGTLDMDALWDRVHGDARPYEQHIWPKMVMTCMDQLEGDKTEVKYAGTKLVVSRKDIYDHLKGYGMKDVLFSYGPTRDDIRRGLD